MNALLEDLPAVRDAAFWDGVDQSFIPHGDVRVGGGLKLHRGAKIDVNPITYELIRYALLNINLEHTALLQKLAVSQIVIHSRDFQTAIMTEDGEVMMVGPCVQAFSNIGSLCIRYALENRSENPGIHAGDVFFTNDCYVGASHQMDGSILAPIFVGDELFCWVTNTLHYADVGGEAAGSFCHAAQDAWHDPLNWPPIKIVERGVLRADVERLFVRQSRFPVIVGMDLRAAIAATEVVRTKLGQLIERYGADTVKAVMRGVQDAGERLFAERLRSIPDGRWSHRYYCQGAVPGDTNVQTMQVNITKTEGRLIVDSRGTDGQVGSISMTYAGFSAAVLAAIVCQIAPDLAGAFGGPYRLIDFRPEPGTIHCASYPAATSASVFSIVMTINAVAITVTKMLSCAGEDGQALALGASAPHAGGVVSMAGQTPDGKVWFDGLSDFMLSSFGGSPRGDGMDFAGQWWMPGASGGNVEEKEEESPFVYLYRRGLPLGLDGAGRYRGGRGIASCVWVRSDAQVIYAIGEAAPGGSGVMGSAPGSLARVTVIGDVDIKGQLAASNIPLDIAALGGTATELEWKTVSHGMRNGDAVETVFPHMAGFGDPLRRDLADVAHDFDAGILTAEAALRVYGVVIAGSAVDAAASVAERRRLRSERLGGAAVSDLVPPPPGAVKAGDFLYAVNGRWWSNGADLGPSDANFKPQAVLRETPMIDVGPEFATPFTQTAGKFVYREFICPRTGYIIDTEMALATQGPLQDIRIEPIRTVSARAA